MRRCHRYLINEYYKETSMSLVRPKASGTSRIISAFKNWVTTPTTVSLAADGEIEVVDPAKFPDPDIKVFERRHDVSDEALHRIGQWYINKFGKRTNAHGNQHIAEKLISFKSPNNSSRERGVAIAQAYINATRRNWSFSEPGELSTLLTTILLKSGYGFTSENLNKPIDQLEWFVLNQINQTYAVEYIKIYQDPKITAEKKAALKTSLNFKEFQIKDVIMLGQWYKEQFVQKTTSHGNQDIAEDLINFNPPNINSRECALAIADACIKALRRTPMLMQPGKLALRLVDELVKAGFGLTREDFDTKPVDTLEWFVKNKINESYAIAYETKLDEVLALEETAATHSRKP